MTIRIGKVRGREKKPNRNGAGDVILLQVEISGPDDVQTVELMTHAGDEASPPNGAQVILVQIGPAWVVALAADDLIPPDIDVGERRVYSQDAGARKATIYWRTDGQLELNGTGDNAVRFAALETAFNQLKSDFNSHGGHFSGEIPPVASTADISGAKVDTIEVPS